MIKLFKITKTAWVAFLLAFLLVFISQVKVHAQIASSSAEQVAKKYSITFPIAELGNCASLNECRTYCEDPLNRPVCVDFGRKKGFYKEKKTAIQNALSIAAKTELGCDSENDCKAFCGNQDNWQKCGEFAKKYNLGGGQVEDPSRKEILNKAKEVLGCSSYDECKGFCTKEENKQKCDEFAKVVGLRGGVEKKGPGGCTSLETCKAFCSDPVNFQICQGFVKSSGGQFVGPGGCNSERSCKEFCKDHQTECKKYFTIQRQTSTYDPQEYCSKTPNCNWINNRCECKSYLIPSSSTVPITRPSPTSGSDITTCQPPSSGCGTYNYFDKQSCTCKTYESYCNTKPGCKWNNNTCQCATPQPTVSTRSYYPFTAGNIGTQSSVKGISTVRILLDGIIDVFR